MCDGQGGASSFGFYNQLYQPRLRPCGFREKTCLGASPVNITSLVDMPSA